VNFTFRYVPAEHVVPYAALGAEARADVAGYVAELARYSAFFAAALAEAAGAASSGGGTSSSAGA
jgi:hypothetical protein